MSKPNVEQNVELGLAEAIEDALNRKNLSTSDLKDIAGVRYESARRYVVGEGVPGPAVLRVICTELGLDYKEMLDLRKAWKITRMPGEIPVSLYGKNPEIRPIERVWEHLTEQQKSDAIAMIVGWSKRNRAIGSK